MRAWNSFGRNRLAVGCAVLFGFYVLIATLTQVGWIATPWDQVVGTSYQAPSLERFELWLGTDLFGRSVLYKTLHGARIALGVGLITSIISIPIGVCLGALAGYFGGWIDEAVIWIYSVLSSIPNMMLLIAITYALGKGMFAVYAALSITAWISLARVIRGEVSKHKQREYVLAAQSLGAGHTARIFRHILPNVSHFVIIHFSIQFMSAIKAEVLLSFLGLGAKNLPSWGVMIDDSKVELARGVWWQLTGASMALFLVVLALNILGDALRDALDPKET